MHSYIAAHMLQVHDFNFNAVVFTKLKVDLEHDCSKNNIAHME